MAISPKPAPGTKSAGESPEYKDELKKLDKSIKAVEESRQHVHRGLKAIGDAVDKKTKALIGDAKAKTKTLADAKQVNQAAANLKKQFDELAKKLDQLRAPS